MKRKKTNPRKIPRTEADVERAIQFGCDTGARLILDTMVYTLATDFKLSDEWLDHFHERFMAHIDSYTKGYITQEDMRKTTLAERGWEVQLY